MGEATHARVMAAVEQGVSAVLLGIVEGPPLRQVDLGRGERSAPHQGGPQRVVGLQEERCVVDRLGQAEEPLPQRLCPRVLAAGGRKSPEPPQHREELWGLPQLLAELLRPGVDLFHRRGSRTPGAHQRRAKGQLQVQFLPGARWGLRQGVQYLDALTEVGGRFGVCRAFHGALPSLLPIGHGRFGASCLRVVMRQQFGLGEDRLGKLGLEHLGHLLMDLLPCARQQRLIGHLLGEGVLEGVDQLGEEARFVEELGGLELREGRMQGRLRQGGNRLQYPQGHLRANHRRRLQQPLGVRRQPVDAGGQHRLHRRRHLDGWQGVRKTIGAPPAHQHPGLDQGAHALFQEEGGYPPSAQLKAA